MFGRKPRLPIDIILGIPHVGTTANTEEVSKSTQENLQLAFELARRNLSERSQKQADVNAKLRPIPVFKPGNLVLVYRPYQDTDGPNPKLLLPWRGPYVICSQLSPVVYRVRRRNETREVSVHLAHIKRYYARKTPPAPDFDKLSVFFLGRQIPLPDLDHPDEAQPKIESYTSLTKWLATSVVGALKPHTTTDIACVFEVTAPNRTLNTERMKSHNVKK